jgi:hypothetical protein
MVIQMWKTCQQAVDNFLDLCGTMPREARYSSGGAIWPWRASLMETKPGERTAFLPSIRQRSVRCVNHIDRYTHGGDSEDGDDSLRRRSFIARTCRGFRPFAGTSRRSEKPGSRKCGQGLRSYRALRIPCRLSPTSPGRFRSETARGRWRRSETLNSCLRAVPSRSVSE